MLSLVGLGLFDEKDLTLRGIEEAKSAGKVYLETYTSNWRGNLDNLEKIINKKISVLNRNELEENSKKILQEAKKENVVIFVGGDPLVATTHSSIVLGAKKSGTKVKIVHSASIVSAIAETGLHIYKFGATVTIPFLEKTKGILPESVYKTIEQNKKSGLHTLCLMDLAGASMTVKDGLEFLIKLGAKFGKKILDENTKVVVYSNSGNSSEIRFGPISALLKKTYNSSPSVIIVPGGFHFTEKEFLNLYLLQ